MLENVVDNNLEAYDALKDLDDRNLSSDSVEHITQCINKLREKKKLMYLEYNIRINMYIDDATNKIGIYDIKGTLRNVLGGL